MKNKGLQIILSGLALLFSIHLVGQQSNFKIESLDVGDFKVYRLQDSELEIPISIIRTIDDDQLPVLDPSIKKVKEPVNVYLIKTLDEWILVDVGLGNYNDIQPTPIIRQLKKLGLKVEDIDKVLITHFHYDHIAGLIDADNQARFPNATVYIAEDESNYWYGDSTQLLQKHLRWAKTLKQFFKPYKNSGNLKRFKANEMITEGIKAIPAHGHTIGHSIYSLTSKGNEMYFIGDLIILGDIQFKYPRLSVTYDSKGKTAVESRSKLFEQVAGTEIIIAAAHLFDFIKIEVEGDLFKALPLKVSFID